MFTQRALKPFDPKQHYLVLTSFNTPHTPAIKLAPKSIPLIIQHYAEKYRCNISIPTNPHHVPDSLVKFCYASQDRLANARKQTGNYRQAFIIGINEGHATPIIYLKENNQEGLLVADSLLDPNQIGVLQKIQELTNLPVFAVLQQQQTDMNSCYTYAVRFSCDATAILPGTNQYYIPHLLAQLKARAKPRDGYFEARLPNELLKYSQLSNFVLLQKETGFNQRIHKNETLEEFRLRYSDMFNNRRLPSYLREKGFKLAEQIEIQFYLNQLRQLTNGMISKEQEAAFLAEAKDIISHHRVIALTLPAYELDQKVSDVQFVIHLHRYYQNALHKLFSNCSANKINRYLNKIEMAITLKIAEVMGRPKLHSYTAHFLQRLKADEQKVKAPTLVAKL